MSKELSTFEILNNVDVSNLTKKKGNFDYLPWSNAVREASKLCPSLDWSFTKYGELSLPYLKTELGYFVECTATISGKSRTQMMPVLDFKNQPSKNPNANDINKSQMRALTKAIALHGLGIDLWAGDDLNEYEEDGTSKVIMGISSEQVEQIYPLICDEKGFLTEKGMKLARAYKFERLDQIKESDFDKILKAVS